MRLSLVFTLALGCSAFTLPAPLSRVADSRRALSRSASPRSALLRSSRVIAASNPGSSDDEDGSAGEEVGGLLSPEDMRQLRKRLNEVRSGDSSASTELYRLMTKDEPASMIVSFLRSSSPVVIEAVQSAVISLLGTLPRQFAVEFSTTTERFAALVYQLQMTGYLFKNVEYVLMLKSWLSVNSEKELRSAFDSIDKDGSGYIDTNELKLFLGRLKGGAVKVNGTLVSPGVSIGDVREFLDVFDADKDNLVSWEEFKAVLGGSELPAMPPGSDKRLAASQPEPVKAVNPSISGKLTVELEGGGKMEVDAAKYVDELRASVQAMQAELAKVNQAGASASATIGGYLANLPKDELRSLTRNMQPEVVTAMRQLVDHVVKGTFQADEVPPPDTLVAISRDALAQVCMWQLILGYRLRQAEAQGEAQQRLGF